MGATGDRLIDHSRQGNHGTLTNMDPATDWVTQNSGYALNFDGSNDYVQIPTSSAYSASQMSVSAWVRMPTNLTVHTPVFNIPFNDVPYNQLAIQTLRSGGSAAFVVGTGTTENIINGSVLPTGRWVHLAGTFDGTNAVFYMDGVAVNSAVLSGSLAISSLGRDL